MALIPMIIKKVNGGGEINFDVQQLVAAQYKTSSTSLTDLVQNVTPKDYIIALVFCTNMPLNHWFRIWDGDGNLILDDPDKGAAFANATLQCVSGTGSTKTIQYQGTASPSNYVTYYVHTFSLD